MGNNINKYKVKKILLSTGERLPILLDRHGSPVFEANIFVIGEIRGRSLASNTIQQVLRAVMVLYLFLDDYQINLKSRLDEGYLLTFNEIESLAAYCRMPLSEMGRNVKKMSPSRAPRIKVVPFEKARQLLTPQKTPTVVSAFVVTRLIYIRNFLLWLITDRVSRHQISADTRKKLLENRDLLDRAITARLPTKNRKGDLGGREGMTPEEQEQLLRAVKAQSDQNPWVDIHTRVRNELIVRWLLGFGIRRGELLNLRVSDISFRKKEVAITRDADDKADPRIDQPLSKTNARILEIADSLLFMTQQYILQIRAQLPAARRHSFLFVSEAGHPLSLSSFTKLFSVLRAKCPHLPQNLCGHILRHSWNENFSDQSDLAGWSDAEEARYREYLQGWRKNSGTAATYCKRGVRRRANEASVKFQEYLERREHNEQ